MAVWLKFCPPVRGVTDSRCASHSAADCIAVGKRLLASPWVGGGSLRDRPGLGHKLPFFNLFPNLPKLDLH